MGTCKGIRSQEARANQAKAMAAMMARRVKAREEFDAEVQRVKRLSMNELVAEIRELSYACAVAALMREAGHEVVTLAVSGGVAGGETALCCFQTAAQYLATSSSTYVPKPHWMGEWKELRGCDLPSYHVKRSIERLTHRAHIHTAEIEERTKAFLAVIVNEDGRALYAAGNQTLFTSGLLAAMRSKWVPTGEVRRIETAKQCNERKATERELDEEPAEEPEPIRDTAGATVNLEAATETKCKHDFLLGHRGKYWWCRKCGDKKPIDE